LRAGVKALFVLFGALCCTSQTAVLAEDPKPKPSLAVAGEAVEFRGVSNGFFETPETQHAAIATVVITNAGDAQANALLIRVIDREGNSLPVKEKYKEESKEKEKPLVPFDVNANDGKRKILTIQWKAADPPLTRLVVFDTKHRIPAVVMNASLKRVVGFNAFVTPLGAGSIFAVVIVAIAFLWVRTRIPVDRRPLKLSTELPTVDKAWKFSDSWAANLTTVGAILGTVLGATDVLSHFFPELELASFSATSALFGLIVVLGPVLFNALRAPSGNGSFKGWLVGAVLTLTAVAAELGTVPLLINRGGFRPWAAVAVAVIGALGVAYYTIRSADQLLYTVEKPKPHPLKWLARYITRAGEPESAALQVAAAQATIAPTSPPRLRAGIL
jgi:hypothetical protein